MPIWHGRSYLYQSTCFCSPHVQSFRGGRHWPSASMWCVCHAPDVLVGASPMLPHLGILPQFGLLSASADISMTCAAAFQYGPRSGPVQRSPRLHARCGHTNVDRRDPPIHDPPSLPRIPQGSKEPLLRRRGIAWTLVRAHRHAKAITLARCPASRWSVAHEVIGPGLGIRSPSGIHSICADRTVIRGRLVALTSRSRAPATSPTESQDAVPYEGGIAI